MRTGLIGRKVGMTQVFTDDGNRIPVTVIKLGPCTVVTKRDEEGSGAIQLGFEDAKPSRVTKPLRGHFAKNGVTPKRVLREFKVSDPASYEVGQDISVDQFVVGTFVDVTGRSVGKGFAGVMKRHGFKGGRASHGAHKVHRSGGSIGQCQDPGRVFKNKKMAGHMGDENITVQNVMVAAVDEERGLLLVKGSIPGSKGGVVIVRDAVKKPDSGK